jgi:hypothetical protein
LCRTPPAGMPALHKIAVNKRFSERRTPNSKRFSAGSSRRRHPAHFFVAEAAGNLWKSRGKVCGKNPAH